MEPDSRSGSIMVNARLTERVNTFLESSTKIVLHARECSPGKTYAADNQARTPLFRGMGATPSKNLLSVAQGGRAGGAPLGAPPLTATALGNYRLIDNGTPESENFLPVSLLDSVQDDKFLAYMYPQVLEFDRYLEQTSHLSINIKGIRFNPAMADEPVAVDEDLEYIHRWTKAYDHRILWKLYNLMWFYKLNPDDMPKFTMMITDTGSHASPRYPGRPGLSHLRYLAKFHESHRLQKKMVKAYLGKTDYLSILEPHPESGYVHAHDLYFLQERPDQGILDKLEHHWNTTCKMGNKEHGFLPEIKEPQDFKNIESLIAYPMAYVGKTSIGAVSEWSKYDLVFNTCLWLSPRHPLKGGVGTRVRAFQPSRSLSAIMNKSSVETGYTHIESTLKNDQSFDEPRVLNRDEEHYEMNIKAWRTFGGGFDEVALASGEKEL